MNSPLRTRFGVFVAVAASLCAAAVSSGQETVANYDFANTGTQNSTVSSSLATASALSLSAGGGRSATAGLDAVAGTYFKTQQSPNVIADSLEAAITTNHYLGFTITPTESLNILSLGFDFGVSNNTGTVTTYTGSWGVFASTTGFTSGAILDTGSYSRANNTGGGAFWVSPSPLVDLSDVPSLQNTVVSPIEFRIYFWDNSATASSTLVVRFDEISLTAASAIPEPSTYAALIGLAALGFVALRRRQARSA